MTSKENNPKDLVGTRKVPASVIPRTVLAEVGLGMLEGALKYGRHNYRGVGVRASVYFDAANRHLDAWWEGEDTDPDSGLSHVTKAIASLVVLRDSMIRRMLADDRPPKSPEGWINVLNSSAAKLVDHYADKPMPKHYTQSDEPVEVPHAGTGARGEVKL